MSNEERETDELKGNRCHVPTMKINCDLEVNIGNENKIIYVYPEKLQYFTANAICYCCGEKIEIKYCGSDTKYVCGEAVICGCLGYYKIVKSGIIFIPSHKLSEFTDDWFPADILHFKAKGNCNKDVKFDVVFTYSRSLDCKCSCNKNC